jgi:hypothetical protein
LVVDSLDSTDFWPLLLRYLPVPTAFFLTEEV